VKHWVIFCFLFDDAVIVAQTTHTQKLYCFVLFLGCNLLCNLLPLANYQWFFCLMMRWATGTTTTLLANLLDDDFGLMNSAHDCDGDSK